MHSGFTGWFFKYAFPVIFIVIFVLALAVLALKIYAAIMILQDPGIVGGFVRDIVDGYNQ